AAPVAQLLAYLQGLPGVVERQLMPPLGQVETGQRVQAVGHPGLVADLPVAVEGLARRLQRVLEVARDAVHLGQVYERAGVARPVAERGEVGQRLADVAGRPGGRADVAVDGAQVAAHQRDGPPV